jgi:hypothetical protein
MSRLIGLSINLCFEDAYVKSFDLFELSPDHLMKINIYFVVSYIITDNEEII